jgi:SAM-dependent methyltransferase
LPSPGDDAVPRVPVDVSDRRAYDDALHDFYDPHYHDEKREPARRAAERILPIVLSLVDVESMLDVGCGPGSWLAVAQRLGVPRVTGVEGEWARAWVDDGGTPSHTYDLVFANLEDELILPNSYDLAICIEVVEHLSPARGESFVADLCRCAPHVLLGAAIPGQQGPNHLNTRWVSYWGSCFAAHGFRPLDVVRGQVWNDSALLLPVRQNPVLFVRDDWFERTRSRARTLPSPSIAALDLVHPDLYAEYVQALQIAKTLGVRDRMKAAAGIPSAALRRVRELRRH